jgi:hypothetical protein
MLCREQMPACHSRWTQSHLRGARSTPSPGRYVPQKSRSRPGGYTTCYNRFVRWRRAGRRRRYNRPCQSLPDKRRSPSPKCAPLAIADCWSIVSIFDAVTRSRSALAAGRTCPISSRCSSAFVCQACGKKAADVRPCFDQMIARTPQPARARDEAHHTPTLRRSRDRRPQVDQRSPMPSRRCRMAEFSSASTAKTARAYHPL